MKCIYVIIIIACCQTMGNTLSAAEQGVFGKWVVDIKRTEREMKKNGDDNVDLKSILPSVHYVVVELNKHFCQVRVDGGSDSRFELAKVRMIKVEKKQLYVSWESFIEEKGFAMIKMLEDGSLEVLITDKDFKPKAEKAKIFLKAKPKEKR